MSVIPEARQRKWFQQIWTGLTGTSTRHHPAPFLLELAERIIRMFSFVGDTVFDPFMGTATTNVAAARCGRNSVGVEVDPQYFRSSTRRLRQEAGKLFTSVTISVSHVSAYVKMRRHG